MTIEISPPRGDHSQNLLFHAKAGLLNVVVCMDRTHINIKSHTSTYKYVNRRGMHSDPVQVVCEVQYRVFNCFVKIPGLLHDCND